MEVPEHHLVLDVGNSRTKAALFAAGRVVRWTAFPNGDRKALEHWCVGIRIDHAVLGSVAGPDPTFETVVKDLCPLFVVDGGTPTMLHNAYHTPMTLGADRLANAVGAACRFPGRPVLAIDAGTCITYDLVEADGSYSGGAITPGMYLRAKAMHAYSSRLPLVTPVEVPGALGRDTRSSLEAGIHYGILGEARAFIMEYGQQRPPLAVVLTGGDALAMARGLKSGIFAHPLLTLEGLHAILVYNRPWLPVDGGAHSGEHPWTRPTG